MHRQPAAGARVAPAISILHAAPFQCGCKAQGAAVASGRPAGTQKGGMHFAAAPAGAYQAPPTLCIPKSHSNMQPQPSGTARAEQAHARGLCAGMRRGFLHWARRSVYPGRTPICSRSPPARPAQSKRTHAAYAPGCSAGFDTGPGALCTQAAPRYAAAALRHGPRRASARTRLMRRDAARALTLGPALCVPRPHPDMQPQPSGTARAEQAHARGLCAGMRRGL
ncbi:MAG: hypothetical protein DBY17_05945 [Oscillospiraceae bacterium]|nr:MAG: hypothetical protein DBY17_05945 [Oscillospiraceae bacterium]